MDISLFSLRSLYIWYTFKFGYKGFINKVTFFISLKIILISVKTVRETLNSNVP